MSTFAQTVSPTPFGLFDAETAFQADADSMVTFVKVKLGDSINSVELTKKMVWTCFEEATLEFGAIVNRYQAQSQILTFMGFPTGSTLSGSEQSLPRHNFEFVMRKAEPYIMAAGMGGSYNTLSGTIALSQSKQDYDIYTDLKDGAGNVVFTSASNSSPQTKLRICEVFHFSPQAAYRFFDTTSAINYLNNEFSFESFTPETVFYVLPVFEDILRAGQLSLSSRVRRSNFSYVIHGTKIRIYPMPTSTNPKNLFLRVAYYPNPLTPAYTDDTVYGVNNLSNIPYGNLKYARLNSIGRQWIRQYTLALCRELLGIVRSKIKSFPIPGQGGELTLNGDDLITHAKEEKEKLSTTLRETLDAMTHVKLIQQQAEETEALMKVLRAVPFPMGKVITTG